MEVSRRLPFDVAHDVEAWHYVAYVIKWQYTPWTAHANGLGRCSLLTLCEQRQV